ncbi:hypothetical protein JCM18237_28890 [Halorubrum luteum]
MEDSDRSRDEPSDPDSPSGGDGDGGSMTEAESPDSDPVGDPDASDGVTADEGSEADDAVAETDAGSGEDDSEAGMSETGRPDTPDDDGGTDADGEDEESGESDADGDDDESDGEGDESDEDSELGLFEASQLNSSDDTDGSEEDVEAEETDEDETGEIDEDETGEIDEADVDEEAAFGGIEGPESDEEMPLAAHIEEMMRRLAVVFLVGGLATLVALTESTSMINYFWNYHIPAPAENRPRLYGPLELPLTRLKVAGIAGVVIGLPAFVYQTYRFMKPGLYENERRYYLAAVPTSLVLGSIGVAFAHFLVLPAIFSYFTTYTADAAVIAFGLAETFNLIVVMLAFMAIVFQIPLFIMLAIMMNLVTREWLEDKRLIFWGAFLGIAFIFSPDPTGMAPIIVTLTMIVLYEGTLAILRWTGN